MFPLWPGRKHTLGSRTALFCMRLMGWTPVLAPPPPGLKFVAPTGPHTSNWDFWPGIFWKFATRSPASFVAKKELFVFPIAGLLRAVGGLPVNRGRAGGNFVDAVVELIQREPEVMLVLAPEGTRAKGPHWKTGFYYMALEAGVPLGVTVLDWGQKRVGVIGYFDPTGDIEADFATIRTMMQGVRGKKPQNETPIIPRPQGQTDQQRQQDKPA